MGRRIAQQNCAAELRGAHALADSGEKVCATVDSRNISVCAKSVPRSRWWTAAGAPESMPSPKKERRSQSTCHSVPSRCDQMFHVSLCHTSSERAYARAPPLGAR